MRHAAVLVAVLLSFAPARLAGQEDVAQLVEELGSEDSSVRYAAYRKLLARKTPEALVTLAKRLPEFSAYAQSLGLSLVTSFPEPGRERALRSFLDGKPSLSRLGAAAWFLQRGEERVIGHIVACLRDPGPPPALNLMLGRLWNVEAPAVLQAVLERVTATAEIADLATALRILARAKSRNAIPKIEEIAARAELDADRRALFAAFLVVMGEGRHREALAAAIPETKIWSQLRLVLAEAQSLDKAVLAAILLLAEEQEGVHFRYTLELLARHRYRPAVPKLQTWLESEDGDRSKAALDALMTMGEDLPRHKLSNLLNSEVDANCIAAASALRRLDDDSGVPRLIEIIEGGGSSKRSAVQELGKFRDRRVVPVLIDMLDDPDSSVRSSAFGSLPVIFRSLFPYRRFDFAATGYLYSASSAQRQPAIAQIRRWWNTQASEK
jgi:HEAT repeat protein